MFEQRLGNFWTASEVAGIAMGDLFGSRNERLVNASSGILITIAIVGLSKATFGARPDPRNLTRETVQRCSMPRNKAMGLMIINVIHRHCVFGGIPQPDKRLERPTDAAVAKCVADLGASSGCSMPRSHGIQRLADLAKLEPPAATLRQACHDCDFHAISPFFVNLHQTSSTLIHFIKIHQHPIQSHQNHQTKSDYINSINLRQTS